MSDTGKVVHASLANQTVKKDQTMQVNLRTQPQLDTRTLEARVTVFTEKPVSYSLSDFSLVVQ